MATCEVRFKKNTFALTDPKVMAFAAEIIFPDNSYFVFNCQFSYTLLFNSPQYQKSTSVRSGERTGHLFL